MRFLAVDYGTRRIGLAWADTNLDVVLPFGIIEKDTVRAQARELADLLKKEQISTLVIGFPLTVEGKEGPNTIRVKQFAFELQKLAATPIEYYDERFTSQAADARGGSVSRDERAAMVILEEYLARRVR